MDSGEYGFGLFLSPLEQGIDCPGYPPPDIGNRSRASPPSTPGGQRTGPERGAFLARQRGASIPSSRHSHAVS